MSDPSSTRTPSSISRRTIVKGAAWAAPVVAMASAAPAFAASQTQNTSINGYVLIGGNCGRSGVAIEINSQGQGYGLFINNTTTSTTITNPFIIFYISVPNLSWTTSSGNSGWTAPTYSGQTITRNGQTLYGYKTSLQTPVTAVNGTTSLPNLHFISSGGSCPQGRQISALGERHVTINGEPRSYDNGVVSLTLGYQPGARPQAKGAAEKSAPVTAEEAGETASF